MKRLLMLPVVVLLALPGLVPSATAGPITQWDQANDGPLAPGLVGTSFQAVDVEFTPSLAAVDTVQLCVGVQGASNATSDVAVQIREGSASGPILGTSSVETTLPHVESGAPMSTLTFEFPSAIALTPGDTYVIGGVEVSGDAWAFQTYDPNDPVWSAVNGAGTWFREGLSGDVASIDPANAASYVAAPTCPGV